MGFEMSFDMLAVIVIGAIAICKCICDCITSIAIAKKSHKSNIDEEADNE